MYVVWAGLVLKGTARLHSLNFPGLGMGARGWENKRNPAPTSGIHRH